MKQTRTRKPFMRLLSAVTAIGSAACMLPAMPGLSAAAASYDLTVGGVTVTSTNAADILGDGVFSYKASTKTLTVKGSNQTQDSNICSYINGLTINVTASSILRSKESIALDLNGNTTITGSETLNVMSDEGVGIYCAGTLAFENAKVMVSGLYGLSGSADDQSRLFIEDSEVFIDCVSGNPAVSDFTGGITFDDESKMTTPESWEWYEWDFNYHDGTIYDYYEEYDEYVDCRVADRVVFGSVETYPFTVAGILVTSMNKDDILGDGTFSYVNYAYHEDEDYEEYDTLHVHGNSTVDHDCMIDNYDSYGLTISIDSDSTFTVTGDAQSAIDINTNTTITGPGKLTIESDSMGIHQLCYCDLYIKDADITINSRGAGMKGESGYVILDRTNLDVTSSEDYAVYGFNNGFSLSDSYITAPENAERMNDGVYAGTSPCTACTIKAVEYYDLLIRGQQVKSSNADDILGDGVFSYDPDSNTLTVNKAATYSNKNNSSDYFIQNYTDDLIINVAADLTINDVADAIHSDNDLKITGNGTLTLNAWNDAIKIYEGATLTIQDATLDLYGDEHCITGGYDGYEEKLIIINSTIHAATSWNTCIYDFENGIELQDCYISEPEDDFVIDSSIHREYGDTINSMTIIPGPTMRTYDLKVCGKRVRNTNAADILGDGVFSYDEESNTLTVNKAASYDFRDNDLDDVILNNINGLTINLAADLTIDCNYEALHTTKDVTITGPGKLTINSYQAAIEVWDDADLTIKDTSILLKGRYGIIGDWEYEYDHSSSCKLVIINSAIQFRSEDDYRAGIAGFNGGVELQNCWFSDPENAYLNEYGVIVYDDEWDNTCYACSITILPGPKPSITKQPANVSGAIDDTVQLKITTAGNDLTYQWQYYNNSTKKWINATGTSAKSKTFKLTVTAADNGRKYRCIVTKPNGNELISNSATVTVNTKITAQPQNASGKIGETAQFSVAATGVGLSYQWQIFNTAKNKWENTTLSGNDSETLSTVIDESCNANTFRCVITDRNGATTTSDQVILTVDTVILTQPKSVAETIGNTAKFTVAATGAGLTYQWQYNSGDGWKNSGASGSKTAQLSISVKAAYDGWKYRCVITDANGATKTSSAATLKIKTKITAQPVDVTAPIGDSAKFSVTATGIGLTYQWQYDSGEGWKNSGATGNKTAELTISAKASYNGWKYRCLITNANGTVTTSSAATLKIKTKITAQPVSANAAIGDTVKYTVKATGAGLTYQWQYNSGSGWKTSGAADNKTATLTINAKASYNGWKYRCVITDANSAATTSSAASLKINTVITAQPADVTAAVGDTAKFTVSATGAGLTYQWQYNAGSGWKTSNAASAQTAELSINAKASYDGWQYRCIITDANGVAATSSAAALQIRINVTAEPSDVSAAIGTTAKFTVTATGAGLTYQWQYNAGSGWKTSNAAGAQTAELSVSAKTSYNGWQYRCIITDAKNATVTTAAATLKIKTKITAQPASVTASAGTAATFTVTATGLDLTYQWQYNSGSGWKTSNAAGAQTPALTINAKASYNGWQYRCVITDGNGITTTSGTAKLTVS